MNTLFPPSRKSLYAGRAKLFAEASGFLTTAVFHLVFVRKRRPRSSFFRGQKRWKSGGTNSELLGGRGEKLQGAVLYV